MASNGFHWVKLSFAAVFFFIALWLVVEDLRRPPAESSLTHERGFVESVVVFADRTTKGYQTGQKATLRLQGQSRTYTFLSRQPGFGAVASLREQDEVELWFDPWMLPHPDSFEVYALNVNGQPAATYQQTIAVVTRGSFACIAVLFLLLGFGALSTTTWGTRRQERAYGILQWIRSILGR